MGEKAYGRLRAVKSLMSHKSFSLNVGCKKVKIADVNLDVDPSVSPNVLGDARALPFRDEVFCEVLFTDVIEHLPRNSGLKALKEIWRVLKRKGTLVLTTPHAKLLYMILDPALWVIDHRHYNLRAVEYIAQTAGFEVLDVFTSGGIGQMLEVLWYDFIIYPISRALKTKNWRLFMPKIIMQMVDNEYGEKTHKHGYTIFVKAKKCAHKKMMGSDIA